MTEEHKMDTPVKNSSQFAGVRQFSKWVNMQKGMVVEKDDHLHVADARIGEKLIQCLKLFVPDPTASKIEDGAGFDVAVERHEQNLLLLLFEKM